VTLRRVSGGTLLGAGMVQSSGMATDLITVTAGAPGSAYVKQSDDGSYVAASNCSAEVTVAGQQVVGAMWKGR